MEIISHINELSCLDAKQLDKTRHLDSDHIMWTAELYRIGALIYLYRLPCQVSTALFNIRRLVDRVLQFLNQLEVCTRPWPPFMVASAVNNDEQRTEILKIFDVMEQKRRTGNVHVARRTIEDLWIQTDLTADKSSKLQIDWKDLVDPKRLPSFI